MISTLKTPFITVVCSATSNLTDMLYTHLILMFTAHRLQHVPPLVSISLCVILHAEAGKQRSMRQLRHMLLSTVYNDEPQVAPAPHPPVHSSFITWLCLFSPRGPFSD